ncbi:MAG: protein BatD [Melioribacteraceae bacterium]|nr:protein BatD [Melioribacteraceae bacterium]
MIKIKAVILFMLIFVVQSFGQQFSVSANRTTVGTNERLQVDFTLDCEDINSIGKREFPPFEGFKILTGPNVSQSMQIINGKVSASVKYSFIMIPTQVGSFTIPSAKIVYKSKAYATKPLNIKVQKSVAGASDNDGYSTADLNKNVFVRAIPNKTNVYKGEQLTVTYKLYTKTNIASPQIQKLPSYNGFWSEDLNSSNNINFQYEMYKDERYKSAVIKKVALFPTKSGKLEVSSFDLRVPVVIKKKRNRRDVFDDFFNDSFFGKTETVDHLASSNELIIDVKELPAGAPESFTGIVGSFNFSAEIEKTDVEINEAVTIKTKISGNGNIKLLDLPEIKLPAGFEKYEPKKSEKINRGNIISGFKSIEYLIVPRVPGVKELDPIEFSYFDPDKNRYVTKKSEKFTLNVKKGNVAYEQTGSGFSKEDVKLLSEDIRFIQTSDFMLERKTEFKALGSWFWSMLIFPVIALVVVVGFKLRHNKVSGNVQLVRSRKAEKAAKKRLKTAEKHLSDNQLTGFYTELATALFGYMEDKLTLAKSELTVDKTIEELKVRNVSEENLNNVKRILEKCEFARFAPDGEFSHAAKELYEDTVKIIVELENSISGKVKSKKYKNS